MLLSYATDIILLLLVADSRFNFSVDSTCMYDPSVTITTFTRFTNGLKHECVVTNWLRQYSFFVFLWLQPMSCFHMCPLKLFTTRVQVHGICSQWCIPSTVLQVA